MDTLKQKAIQDYTELMADLEKNRAGIELLPDGLSELGGRIYGNTSNGLRVDIAFTFTAFATARKMLGNDWKREGYEWTQSNGDRYFSFVHKEVKIELTLCLRVDLQGATCERRKIGVKEEPIYEVICNA